MGIALQLAGICLAGFVLTMAFATALPRMRRPSHVPVRAWLAAGVCMCVQSSLRLGRRVVLGCEPCRRFQAAVRRAARRKAKAHAASAV